MSDLLSELLVQGASKSISSSLASAISGALAGSVGNLAGNSLFGGLKFSDPALQATVKNLQSQLPASQPAAQPAAPAAGGGAPAAGTDLSDVVVQAGGGGAANATSGALGQVIGGAGANFLAGGSGADTVAAPQQQDQNGNPVGNVSELAVTAPKPLNISPRDLALGGAVLGGGALLAGAGGGAGATAPTTVDEVTVNGHPPGQLTPTEAGLAGAGLVGAGVLATGGGGAGADGAQGADGGGGIDPKTLIVPAAIVGSTLLGGGSDKPGSLTDKLSSLADSNVNLTNRLGSIATAGMAGDIGGKGLNSIARMVRKAQAAIRQRYSNMGMSGSTAENQDLQAAADSGVDLQFKVGQEMATTGLNAIAALTGQSASIYTSLLNAQTAKDTALGNALANFAGSLVH